jgi:hypothetical protein
MAPKGYTMAPKGYTMAPKGYTMAPSGTFWLLGANFDLREERSTFLYSEVLTLLHKQDLKGKQRGIHPYIEARITPSPKSDHCGELKTGLNSVCVHR